MQRALRGLVFLSALACTASAPERPAGEDAEPGRRLRHSGSLAGRRVASREALGALLPAGAALPFPATRRANRAGEDVQVNDPSLDHVNAFAGIPDETPFFSSIQSEASLAVSGQRIVVTYNSTAGLSYGVDAEGKVALTSALLVGFSASSDGGRTFRSGLLPPLPGAVETYFDNAVDADRDGRFYAAYFSVAPGGGYAIVVSRSDDGGLTWGAPVPAAQEAGMDKPWLAVGPDPVFRGQDVVYVTWTVFKARSSELRIARSVDAGRTFAPPGSLFVPVPSSLTGLAGAATFSTPFVDPESGRLYVAFAQSTAAGTWAVRLAVSDDGGSAFSFLSPAVPGAPAPDIVPAVQPGHPGDCGESGVLTVLHAGPDVRPSGGRTPRFAQSWWIGDQPFVAARGDLVALAWASSTSAVPLDAAAGSRVFVIVSRDRGATWTAPRVVHAERPGDVQHVSPSLAIDAATRDVHVTYTVQHADETLDTELATFREADGYGVFHTTRLTSQPSTIPPSNVPVSDTKTVSYDAVGACYSLGHYMQVRASDGLAYAAWNDARHTVTHPVDPRDPLSGRTHSQPDVYFRAVRP